MAESKTPLLDLNTLTERSLIKINDGTFELRNPGELSLLSYRKLETRSAEMEALMEQESLSDNQVEILAKTLDSLVEMVLDAPDEVRAQLNDLHKLRILQVFNELSGSEVPAPETATEDEAPKDLPIGEII